MMGNIGCLCEACWKGYEKKGMKKMFGKMYPNCVKKESMTEDGHTDVASAKRAMKVIAEDAIDMFKTLKSMNDEGSLPSWWMNKIAISKTYMNSARDYMKNPNESVNEIFPKGAGRKISKAMQKTIEPQGNIKKVLDVAKNKQAKKIGGTLVDGTTANMMTQVWNKVNDSSKEKMNKMNTKQLINLILKMWKAIGTPRV